MVQFNLDVPFPTLIETDREAKDLLHRLLRKIEEEPEDFIGFDTETHGKKIPLKGIPEKPAKSDPLDWMRDTVTFWSLSAKLDGEYYRWCLDQTHLHIFIPLLENPDAHIVTWNGKYDAHVCYNSGIYVWASDYMDAMAMGYLVDENLQGSMSLKDRAADKAGFIGRDPHLKRLVEEGKIEEWKPIPMTKFKDLFGDKDEFGNKLEEYTTSLYDLPRKKVADYASLDAYSTLRLAEHLQEVMEEIEIEGNENTPNMWEYYRQVEVECTEVFWRMERRGLGLNTEYLQNLIGPMDAEVLEIEREIYRVAGWPVNLNSTAHLVQLFFGKKDGQVKMGKNMVDAPGLGLKPKKMTKGGQSLPKPSTDKEVLDELAADGVEIAKLVKKHRKIKKILSTYVVKLIRLAQWHEDQRLHPNFHQFGARTGRASTSDPNSQNFPNPDKDDYKIRGAFVALVRKRVRKVLIVADYAQLEMRIMAHFSGDEGMLAAIRNGLDLHCVTVEKMFGVPYDEVIIAKKAKDLEKASDRQLEICGMRSDAKTIGFGIIYCAGAKTIGLQLECPEEVAQEKIDLYFEAFPGVYQHIEETKDRCYEMGYVETILGRRRRLPDIRHHAFVKYSHAEREAVNAEIQGTAADMVKLAMLNIEFSGDLQHLGVELENQIHDELVCSAPEDTAPEALPIIQHEMEYPFAGEQALCIPSPVDIKIVQSWDQAK